MIINGSQFCSLLLVGTHYIFGLIGTYFEHLCLSVIKFCKLDPLVPPWEASSYFAILVINLLKDVLKNENHKNKNHFSWIGYVKIKIEEPKNGISTSEDNSEEKSEIQVL